MLVSVDHRLEQADLEGRKVVHHRGEARLMHSNHRRHGIYYDRLKDVSSCQGVAYRDEMVDVPHIVLEALADTEKQVILDDLSAAEEATDDMIHHFPVLNLADRQMLDTAPEELMVFEYLLHSIDLRTAHDIAGIAILSMFAEHGLECLVKVIRVLCEIQILEFRKEYDYFLGTL